MSYDSDYIRAVVTIPWWNLWDKQQEEKRIIDENKSVQ